MVANKWLLLLLSSLALATKQLLSPRIMQGHNATEGQFPYMAAMRDFYTSKIFCSAAIIDVEWILTAAHCIYMYRATAQNVVYVGSTVENPTAFSQQYPANQIFTYSQTRKSLGDAYNHDDIALVQLSEPLALSPAVQPISLGRVSETGETGTLIGWGGIDSVGYKNLGFGDFTIIENEKCQEIYAMFNYFLHSDKQICTYSEEIGLSPCFGDSGGPLVSKDTGRLLGIASMVMDCTGHYPVVYTRVSAYVGWIEAITGLKFPLK